MELGQKLRRARQELGLTQRQLCGDTITRNMLSLIESGTASPSLETLRFLAGQLGKPVSYFLDEDAVVSANQQIMLSAREAYARGEYQKVLEALQTYRAPDQLFDWEEALLRALAAMSLAEEAILRGKEPYALELLEQSAAAGKQTPYYTPDLERRRLLTLGQLRPVELPADDRGLLLQAKNALARKEPEEAARYLEAASDRSSPGWYYLRGQSLFYRHQFAMARTCFEAAWEHDPRACAGYLEQCCKELEDFKEAYRYACFLREA